MLKKFEHLNNWEDRYKRIIQLGHELPSLKEEEKIDLNKVSGCQSQVWMLAELNAKKKVIFRAESDALIVKGLIALLLLLYSDLSPKEILETHPEFMTSLKLDQNLSMSRANGLKALIKKMKFYALAFENSLQRESKSTFT